MSAFTVATTMVKKENVEIYVGLNPVLSPYSDMEQIKEPACKIILDGWGLFVLLHTKNCVTHASTIFPFTRRL